MPNGQSKEPLIIVPAPKVEEKPELDVLVCHRFYAPVVVPQADRLDPRKINMQANLGSFFCIGSKCTLWNPAASECRDVTDSKSRAKIAEYADAKLNDVHVQMGGM